MSSFSEWCECEWAATLIRNGSNAKGEKKAKYWHYYQFVQLEKFVLKRVKCLCFFFVKYPKDTEAVLIIVCCAVMHT